MVARMTLFSRRHYEAIAAAIRTADRYDDGSLSPGSIITNLVETFKRDNRKFDADRFWMSTAAATMQERGE